MLHTPYKPDADLCVCVELPLDKKNCGKTGLGRRPPGRGPAFSKTSTSVAYTGMFTLLALNNKNWDLVSKWCWKWCDDNYCLGHVKKQWKRFSRVPGRNQTYKLLSSIGVLVAQWLEHTLIKEVIGSFPTWNSENLFCSFLTYCQATIIT